MQHEIVTKSFSKLQMCKFPPWHSRKKMTYIVQGWRRALNKFEAVALTSTAWSRRSKQDAHKICHFDTALLSPFHSTFSPCKQTSPLRHTPQQGLHPQSVPNERFFQHLSFPRNRSSFGPTLQKRLKLLLFPPSLRTKNPVVFTATSCVARRTFEKRFRKMTANYAKRKHVQLLFSSQKEVGSCLTPRPNKAEPEALPRPFEQHFCSQGDPASSWEHSCCPMQFHLPSVWISRASRKTGFIVGRSDWTNFLPPFLYPFSPVVL